MNPQAICDRQEAIRDEIAASQIHRGRMESHCQKLRRQKERTETENFILDSYRGKILSCWQDEIDLDDEYEELEALLMERDSNGIGE